MENSTLYVGNWKPSPKSSARPHVIREESTIYVESKNQGPEAPRYTWNSPRITWKNEERKLAEQETKFGSKTEQELHAYACYNKPKPRLSNSITL
ncbi:hypothetical protein PIB30_108618, partial [Stylosanthes scabra]|nr:hypothetical protein [Stylosanthes scabra]